MKTKLFILSLLLIFSITFISAVTILEVKTLPNSEIYITGLNPSSSSFDVIKNPMHTFTGKKGIIRMEYPIEISPFNLALRVKNGSKTLVYKIFDGNFEAGTFINLTLAPEGVDLDALVIEKIINVSIENITEIGDISNVSLENNEIIEEVEPDKNALKGIFINGYAIIQENKYIKNVFSYFSLAIILLVPLLYLGIKHRGKIKNITEIIPNVGRVVDEGEELKKAEAELKRAKDKVDGLKNNKIDAVKKRLMEDERELLRLRGERKE